MKRFEAQTLSQAIEDAAKHFKCSVLDLQYQVVQNSSNGFLGFFKKPAIIDNVFNKNDKSTQKNQQKPDYKKRLHKNKKEDEIYQNKENCDKICDNTDTKYEKTIITDEILQEIKTGLNTLLKSSCFNIDKINVEKYDENSVLIELDGEDAALLIGKEGYRYKAISYLLFNWINSKYSLSIRLEIAQFLKNQEERMGLYLQSVAQRVEKNGYAKTKILDGVLVKIALEFLRKRFPNKYVGIKKSSNGKSVIINDFAQK